MGPTSPILRRQSPRSRLAGGQSDRSGRWASRVWITGMPSQRAVASSRAIAGTQACKRLTSLPSASPKPPGSTKSRCMSMTTRAGGRSGSA